MTYMKSMFEEYLEKNCIMHLDIHLFSNLPNKTSDTASSNINTKSTKVRNRHEIKWKKQDTTCLGDKSELEKYLSYEQELNSDDFDIFQWWIDMLPEVNFFPR